MSLPEQLFAPLEKGAVLGELHIAVGGKVLSSAPLHVLKGVSEGSLLQRWSDQFELWTQ